MSNETKPATISLDANGNLMPTTIDDAFRVAKAHAMSGMLPERYNGKPEMVFTAMQMAREMGLPPITALRQIAVIKGTPSLFGDLPLAVVQASRKLQSMKERWLDINMVEIAPENKNLSAEVFAASCKVWRVGDPEPGEAFFTMKEAQAAGLLKNPTWVSYPKRMLRYRARSQALKDKFADCLNGIGIGEYDHNIVEEQIPSGGLKPSDKPAEDSVINVEVFEAEAPKKESMLEKLARKKAEVEKAKVDVVDAVVE